MSNIVVDTNVLVHSANPENNFFADSVAFLVALRASAYNLCVDEGFDAVEARNRSRIWSEYIEHVPRTSLATEVLADLLIADRVRDVPTAVARQLLDAINQAVTDKSDRVFVKVAYNSASDALVSHDDAAFPARTRRALRKAGIVNIVNAGEHAF